MELSGVDSIRKCYINVSLISIMQVVFVLCVCVVPKVVVVVCCKV